MIVVDDDAVGLGVVALLEEEALLLIPGLMDDDSLLEDDTLLDDVLLPM